MIAGLAVWDPIPRSWNLEFYMVITAPEASWGVSFLVVLETLGHVSYKGTQDRGKGGIPKVVPP